MRTSDASTIAHDVFVADALRTHLEIYRLQPAEIISHFNREVSVLNAYRGRQLLELLQNADDAGIELKGGNRILLQLTSEYLAVANTGVPFSQQGFQSLLISDNSPKRLHRSQCIGNKGLGFRSVLSWSCKPLVLSGENAIAFSAEKALEIATNLGGEIPELRNQFDDWLAAEERLPVPTMRFPFVPEKDNPWLQIATEIKTRGYDTVILLPLLSGKYTDVLSQLQELSGETALFCRKLNQLKIESKEVTETWEVERDPENQGVQSTIIKNRGSERIWTVHRRTGRLTKAVLDDRVGDTPSYEVALAVPDETKPCPDHKLCVFFPTDDGLPMPMLAHATLETDDNRKRLTKHAANREVLSYLAELIAEVVEKEAMNSSSDTALALLTGIEGCDKELKEFGFLDRVIIECRRRRIFQRLDGRFADADQVRLPKSKVWRILANREIFPEMFATNGAEISKRLLQALRIADYEDSDLSKRVETLFATMSPRAAGDAFGDLLDAAAIPQSPLPGLLRDEQGLSIPAEGTSFLPPEGKSIALPEWARQRISVLHPEFLDALRKRGSESKIRDVRSRLRNAGYTVEEFSFETLARRLEQVALEEDLVNADFQHERCRDVLRCLFHLSSFEDDLAPIKSRVRVVTTNGFLKFADLCYFGPDYGNLRLAYDLYRLFGEDEFIASPTTLGLEDQSEARINGFLKRLGLTDQPRSESIVWNDAKNHGLVELLDDSLQEAPDLSAAFGSSIDKPREVYEHFSGLKIEGLELPDRFIKLVDGTNLAPLITYLAGPGATLISHHYSPSAVLKAKPGLRFNLRSYPVRILNPVIFILKRKPWVPCTDGGRRRPDQIILHRHGGVVFEGTYFNHALALLTDHIDRSTADSVLLRLGSINSLESLRPPEMYRLLTELPERDPQGAHAPGIYRTLLEVAPTSEDPAERQAFIVHGTLWGRRDAQTGYFPVLQLRYSSRASLPAPVRKLIPLVEIDARRSASQVERIFGVKQLKPSDVDLTVDPTFVQSHLWSCFVNERLRQALPYLYASRLARKVDEDGRDLKRLKKASICVCKEFRAKVTVEGVSRDDVVFNTELEGTVVDSAIYLVSHRNDVPRSNQSFWRAVGNLLADLVEASVGGDFASILTCETPDDMHALLDQMSENNADSLLANAQARLATDSTSQEFRESLLLVPPPGPTLPTNPTPPTHIVEVSAPVSVGSGNNRTFQPASAPPKRASQRTRFSSGSSASRGGKRMIQVTGEAETTELATRFEELESRFIIAVSHIHGYAGPRCDLLSVASKELCDSALENSAIQLDNVVRFIEVKGRNQRTGAVELTENELLGAETYRDRYFIYRVFCDPTNPTFRELAILCDPIGSPAVQMKRVAQFSFDDQSGANWFSLVTTDEKTDPDT